MTLEEVSARGTGRRDGPHRFGKAGAFVVVGGCGPDVRTMQLLPMITIE
jgi:hypothetical protein